MPAVCIRYDRGSEWFFVLLAGDRLGHNRLPCAANARSPRSRVPECPLKLRAALPPELWAQVERTRSRFHLDAPGWYAEDDDLHARLYRGKAMVRLLPRAASRLTGAAARALAETGTAQPDGWIRAVLPIESLEHAYRAFLALGADVEVLGPPELRARIAETSRTVAARYAPPDRRVAKDATGYATR